MKFLLLDCLQSHSIEVRGSACAESPKQVRDKLSIGLPRHKQRYVVFEHHGKKAPLKNIWTATGLALH